MLHLKRSGKDDLLLLLSLVLLSAVIEQLLVHLHKELQSIVDEPMNCPVQKCVTSYSEVYDIIFKGLSTSKTNSVAVLVPVTLGVLVESGEHDGQDLSSVVTDQAHDVLVVPVIQCSFSNLQQTWPICTSHNASFTSNMSKCLKEFKVSHWDFPHFIPESVDLTHTWPAV